MRAKTLTTTFCLAAAAAVVLVAAGCATGGSHSAATIGKADQAVMCDKCQTVWVERPDMSGEYVARYTADQQVVCPDCQSAVSTFFSTGKWEHSCSHCGGQLKHCTVHSGS